MNKKHRPWAGFFLLLCLCVAALAPARAERVQTRIRPDLVALGDYRPGRPDKPAVLILHGFLQTHDFPTIFRMSEGLSAEGYTTLAPTLTLGVTHRRSSLACEAIHAHTLDDDLKEISHWVKWLKQRHRGDIVLIGHSLGSMALLAYLDQGADPAVGSMIGVSIMEGRVSDDRAKQAKAIAELRRLARAGKHAPQTRAFSFCKTFNATPESVLSYLEWTPERVMDASNRQRARLTYIMGSRDDRLGAGWLDALQHTGVKVRVIQGANHFMDGEHEFDLLDTLLEELRTPRRP
jgi:dienelactone hydrolase